MNDKTPSSTDTAKVRLTLDVSYILNGEPLDEMVANLEWMCQHAIGNGMLTGETAAEVDVYEVKVSRMPDLLPEAEIARFMLQRIEDEDLLAEDIPTRLARYGLMEPGDFVVEMRERMETASDG